jgi:hypothetical protein
MSEDSLIREVEEELRREQLEKLWKRYGNWFIAFSIGIIVAVAGYKGWQYYELRKARAAGEALASAMDLLATGKTEEARLKLVDIAGGGHRGAAVLARLEQAGLALGKGDRDSAMKIYAGIMNDETVDEPLRDAARVRLAWLKVDAASRDELKRLLAGLDVQGSPWRPAAREILALAAWRAGDLAEMKKLLSAAVTDPETPPAARERARIMLEVIAPRLAAQKKNDASTGGGERAATQGTTAEKGGKAGSDATEGAR